MGEKLSKEDFMSIVNSLDLVIKGFEEILKRLNGNEKQTGVTHGEENTVHADEADVHVCGDTVQHAEETQED